MSILKMSDEEKEKIREQHKKATKEFYDKKAKLKNGPVIPKKKKDTE